MNRNWLKSLICATLLIVLITATAFAAGGKFNYTLLEKLDGYKYDKFDDTWTYYRAYVEKYSDAYAVIGIQLEGDKEGISYAPTLYTKINDTSNKPLYTVTKISFLVDGAKFEYNSMLEGSDSSVMLGKEGKKLVDALSNCKSVSVKLTFGDSYITIDLDQKQVETTLKAISKQLIKNNVWDYIDSSMVDFFETLYPISITATAVPTATPKAAATKAPQYTVPPRLASAKYELGTNTQEVLQIKQRMQLLGYFSEGAELSGNYNSLMQERIQMFQKDYGLSQTGVIDKTFLNTLYGEKVSKKIASKEAAVKAQQTIDNYKSSCATYDYDDVARKPNTYFGKRMKISGKVLQVMEGSNDEITLRVQESYNRVWYITYVRSAGENRILENDRVKVYGVFKGLQSYETVLRTTLTIPYIDAKYIDVQ